MGDIRIAPQQRGSGRADDQHLAGELVQRPAQPREAPAGADIARLAVAEKQVIGAASAAVHPRFGIAVAGRTAKDQRPRTRVRSVADLRPADIGTDAPQADGFTGVKTPRRRAAVGIFTGFGQLFTVVVRIHGYARAELPDIADALCGTGVLPRFIQRRQQHRRQNRDDRYDNEQLNKSKLPYTTVCGGVSAASPPGGENVKKTKRR